VPLFIQWSASLKRQLAMTALAGLSLFCSASAHESLYAPACCHEVKRAGHPWRRAPWAVPSNACAYDGYYVGGGAHTYRAACRHEQEGTWGWDYVGRGATPFVRLGWWHVPRKQGGAGSYEPDGPRLLHFEHESSSHASPAHHNHEHAHGYQHD